MRDDIGYEPPKIWTWERENGGTWASQNRPSAGPTHKKILPQGKHPFQLYSQATPNGQKITILFEELLAAGETGAEYDAWLIRIGKGEQFGSGFTELNPNSKIPVLYDVEQGVRVFESGAILLYLAERFGRFLPSDHATRTETLNWLFWLQGSAPYLGGGFGHFYAYAPYKMEYPIDRYAMETKRQLDVLDREFADKNFIAGDVFTIADIAIWPWYGNMVLGRSYNAAEFLQVQEYTNVVRWAEAIWERPAVRRGWKVNRFRGAPEDCVPERHSAADIEAVGNN